MELRHCKLENGHEVGHIEDQYGGSSEGQRAGVEYRESSSMAIVPGQVRLTENPPQDWRVGMEDEDSLAVSFRLGMVVLRVI